MYYSLSRSQKKLLPFPLVIQLIEGKYKIEYRLVSEQVTTHNVYFSIDRSKMISHDSLSVIARVQSVSFSLQISIFILMRFPKGKKVPPRIMELVISNLKNNIYREKMPIS